ADAPGEDHAHARLGVAGGGHRLGDGALDVRARGDAQTDARGRPLQAIQVIAGGEQAAVDRPDRLINAVAVEESTIENGNLRLLGGRDSTVDVYANGHARVRT